MMAFRVFTGLLILLLANRPLFCQQPIVVDAGGKGDFKTIQEALNSLPDSSGSDRIILIRKGIYHEKLFITGHRIELQGEDRDQTIITFDIARDEWRCSHQDDWGVATCNVSGNDITLRNLTIANEFGFHFAESRTISCENDSATPTKTISRDGHQMALRTMLATRLRAINCRFRAFAGDTVSPWNVTNGQFYFRDCLLEGGVDFYCPRGWAWAENCRFYANTGSASIWHDGSGDPDQKTVLKDCEFDGFDGFKLGRYHRDAQFFLVNCRFSERMSDTPIYRVPVNQIKWGERIYYYNCHRRSGKDFDWYADYLPGKLKAVDITPEWLFGKSWRPTAN